MTVCAIGAVSQANPVQLGSGVAPSHPPVPSPTYPGAAAVASSLTLATDMPSQAFQESQVKEMEHGFESFSVFSKNQHAQFALE